MGTAPSTYYFVTPLPLTAFYSCIPACRSTARGGINRFYSLHNVKTAKAIYTNTARSNDRQPYSNHFLLSFITHTVTVETVTQLWTLLLLPSLRASTTGTLSLMVCLLENPHSSRSRSNVDGTLFNSDARCNSCPYPCSCCYSSSTVSAYMEILEHRSSLLKCSDRRVHHYHFRARYCGLGETQPVLWKGCRYSPQAGPSCESPIDSSS